MGENQGGAKQKPQLLKTAMDSFWAQNWAGPC